MSGVPLTQLVAIEAALAEGFGIDEILDIEGIEGVDASSWAAAQTAWRAKIVGSTQKDDKSGLFADYKAKLAEAEDRLRRRVSPLDEDLRAWASFLKIWSGHASPFDFLRGLGLGMNDISRLSRQWALLIDADPELRTCAPDIAAKAKPELPPLRVEPRALRPSPLAKPRAAPSASGASNPEPPEPLMLEFAYGPGATRPAVAVSRGPAVPFLRPDPDAPLRLPPVRPIDPQWTGTEPMRALPRGPVLPFPGGEAPPFLVADEDNETSPFVAIRTTPVLPFQARPAPPSTNSSDDRPAALTLEQHASLTLELTLYPDRTADVLQRYRLSAADLGPLNDAYKARFAADPALYIRWRQAYRTYYAWLVSAAQGAP